MKCINNTNNNIHIYTTFILNDNKTINPKRQTIYGNF